MEKLISLFSFCIVLLCLSCSSDDDPDPGNNSGITQLPGTFPKQMDLPPGGGNGVYDATVATDPSTGRVWMIYSQVIGVIGGAKVSTHLCFSDDGGDNWTYSGLVNQAEDILVSEIPAEFPNATKAYWQHEVPSIAIDEGAPANERWRILWHRYLHVDDGVPNNEDRKFTYGWIGTKTASSPDQLLTAPEQKLFSSYGYHITAEIEAYNDAVLGPPEIKLHELNSNLALTVAFSEMGMQFHDGDLYVSTLTRTIDEGFIDLIKLDHSTGNWEYVNRLLTPPQAKGMNSNWKWFSATDIFIKGNQAYLLVSPVIDLYAGTLLMKLNLNTGIVQTGSNGLPTVFYSFGQTQNSIQTGVSTYDPGLTKTGILLGDAFSVTPQFRMYTTGVVP